MIIIKKNLIIIGAGCFVAKDIPDNSVVVGNPARVICSYDEYVNKTKEKMKRYPVLDLEMDEVLLLKNTESKEKIMENGFGFVL